MKDGDAKEAFYSKVKFDSLSQIKALMTKIKLLEKELEGLKEDYKGYKEVYKDADRALAELSGKVRVIPIGRRREKSVKLSLTQINSIAEKLGIKL